MPAASVGYASGYILTMFIEPEILYSFCPWAQSQFGWQVIIVAIVNL